MQLALVGHWPESIADLVVERHAAHGILIANREVSQTDGDCRAVFKLIQMPVAESHAVGDVHQQIDLHFFVRFVLLNVQTILPRPDLPIDVPKIIAGRVLAVLAKLNRLSEVGTTMHARQVALDDLTSPQIHPGDALDRFRM